MNISDFFTNALDLMNQHGVFEKDYHLELDRSKSRLGLCNHTKKKITISKNFVEQQDWDVIKNTVLHEIAHALVGPNHGHNHVWRQQAMAIGGYDVFLSTGVTYQNVSRDVVRCVAGSDLDHMLKTAGDDYIKVSANDLKDFSMHKEN